MAQPGRNGNWGRISAANPFTGMFPHEPPVTDVFRTSTLSVHYTADKCPCQENILLSAEKNCNLSVPMIE